MAHVERMQTECPPDAHKVIRPPLSEVNATICVKLNAEELKKYGVVDFCEVLGLMSAKPLVLCDDNTKTEIEKQKAQAELEVAYLQIEGEQARIIYANGLDINTHPFYDLTANPNLIDQFFDLLQKKCFIIIDSLSMLILRSISTVFPWDNLLAGDFIRQYKKARAAISQEDIAILTDIRYGRVDGFSIKTTHPEAYAYLRLERKLFLQYPTEDDD